MDDCWFGERGRERPSLQHVFGSCLKLGPIANWQVTSSDAAKNPKGSSQSLGRLPAETKSDCLKSASQQNYRGSRSSRAAIARCRVPHLMPFSVRGHFDSARFRSSRPRQFHSKHAVVQSSRNAFVINVVAQNERSQKVANLILFMNHI